MAEVYGFDEAGKNRVIRAVRAVEGASLGGGAGDSPPPGLQCVFAKLTSRHSTDLWVYAWSQARPTATGWELVAGGLSGTTSDRPALYPDTTSTVDLTNLYVILVRGTRNESGTIGPAWVIAGFALSVAGCDGTTILPASQIEFDHGFDVTQPTPGHALVKLKVTADTGISITKDCADGIKVKNTSPATAIVATPGGPLEFTLNPDGTITASITTTSVTVVTDVRVDGTNKKLQYKSRSITVIAAGTESGWTDFHTGVGCTPP